MDRRRFVPKPEGLEDRQLQANSLFGSAGLSNSAASDVPVTFAQKQLRIDHLPYYLEQIKPGRFLSSENMSSLQTDLRDVLTKLHRPNPQGLVNFNELIRKLEPHVSVSAEDANALSHAFGVIIANAGATQQQVANLQADMTKLTQIDSQSSQPIFLATNDYSLVLQTTLGIGPPIQRPAVPALAAKDGTRSSVGYAISHVYRPTLVGTYGVGDTVGVFAGGTTGGFNSAGDVIQVVDINGKVLGQSTVNPKNGNYSTIVATPLPNGVYTLFVRAVDPLGNQSDLSPAYHVKISSRRAFPVVTGQATPQGPAAP